LNRLQNTRNSGVAALILAPTRELAAQISREFSLFSRNTALRAAVIVGGESMSRQVQELRSGAQVLIACPGRLIDHLERGTVKLDRVSLVVIDEADRMLDMGFLPQLRRVLRTVRTPRQTLMFSATMDAGVEQVAREFLHQPDRINVGEVRTPPAEIRQTIYPVTMDNKAPMLVELLGRSEVNSAIVFTRTKSRADATASRRSRFMAGDRKASAMPRWPAFARAITASWLPLTLPPAASTFPTFLTSSTSTCPRNQIPTSIASAEPPEWASPARL
jgi:ATP-dependent RNA helicase RhlE